MGKNQQTKICKFCGSEMNKKSKFCQECGKKQKKGCIGCLIPILVILGIVFALFVVLMFAGDEEDVTLQPQTTTYDSSESLDISEIKLGTIYDKHDVKITTTDYKMESGNIKIGLLIENDSTKNMNFYSNYFGVNGLMVGNYVDDAIDCDVAAGKKANTELIIPSSFLNYYEFEEVQYIDLLIWAYDMDAYYKDFETGKIRLETPLNKDEAYMFEGDDVFDKNGVTVTYITSIGGKHYYSLRNNSGEDLYFYVRNLVINDYTVDDHSIMYYQLEDECIIDKNTHVIEIKADEEFLEENNINNVQSLEFNLEIHPSQSDTWNTDTIKLDVE